MATSTIKPKKGTTAQWAASGRVLEVNEWGVEVTENGHHILRIGDGEHLFHELPAVFDAENYEELMAQAVDATNAANTATANADTARENADAAAAAALAAANTASIAAQANTNAVIETVSGEIVTMNDSSDLALTGLKLYGKTTQDGEPSPENPIPLVSVGDGGSITVKVGISVEDTNPQILTTQTPTGLPGLPTAYTGNYTDANGQQWVCDEVDFARGVYVQRIVERVLDGTESWVPSSTATNEQLYFVTKLGAFEYAKDYVQMSSHFIGTPINVNTRDIGISVVNSTARNQVQASVRPGMNITTVTALKAWLAENPVTLMYALTTPIETALSAEEIAAFKALHSNKPNTTVYNDSGAGMEIEYIADTKTYIDNKFAELQNAILSAGANV